MKGSLRGLLPMLGAAMLPHQPILGPRFGPKKLKRNQWWGTSAPAYRIGPANSRQVNRHLAIGLATKAVNKQNPTMSRCGRRMLARAYAGHYWPGDKS